MEASDDEVFRWMGFIASLTLKDELPRTTPKHISKWVDCGWRVREEATANFIEVRSAAILLISPTKEGI
jgi:hypothetical protein